MGTRNNPIVIWRGTRSGDKQSSTGDAQAGLRQWPFTDGAGAVGNSVSEALWVTPSLRSKRDALALPSSALLWQHWIQGRDKRTLCSGPSEQDQGTNRSRWKRPKQELRGGGSQKRGATN